MVSGIAIAVLCDTQSTLAEVARSVAIDEVATAWEQRSRPQKSGKVTWLETAYFAEGSIVRAGANPYGSSQNAAVPAKDTTVNDQMQTLTFLGNRLRYSGSELVASGQFPGELVTHRWESVWDDSISVAKSLSMRDPRLRFSTCGFVYQSANRIVSSEALTPLLIYYRPTLFKKYLYRFSVGSSHRNRDGIQCLVLENMEGGASTRKETMWLDPKRDFIVLQWTSELNGSLVSQRDVTYSQDNDHGWWIPSGWAHSEFDEHGSPKRSVSAEVTHTVLNSTDISPGSFHLAFPPNTLVRDYTKVGSSSAVTTNERYLVRPDHSIRPIVRGELERGATLPMLLNTEPGKAALATGRTNWLLIANATFLILLLTYGITRMVWRRRLQT